MNNKICDKIKLISAPQNYEVIQQTNGKATIEVCGTFVEDHFDDTFQNLTLDKSLVYARIINEIDNSFATNPTPINMSGNDFSVSLENIPCGGPYTLDFIMLDKDNRLEYHVKGERRYHFCVGDVFVVAGQSNAAGMGKDIIEDEPEIGVHVLRNLSVWDIASYPFNDSDYAKHGMHLTFAKRMKKELGYPIGLIPAAMGAASISRWLESENGDLYIKLKNVICKNKIRFKAVLWYQGCTDAGDKVPGVDYLTKFTKLTEAFRKDFKNENLPIFTFQLNRMRITGENPLLDRHYDEIREAQRIAPSKISNVYVLPAIDGMHMSDFIHLSSASNRTMGTRLALQVLKELYGKGTGIYPPEIDSAYLNAENHITLSFKNVVGYLDDLNSKTNEYPITISDEEGIVPLKESIIKSNTIEITTDRAIKGKATASGQTGTNPKNIIIDFYTQLPMMCFCDFKIKEL